MYECFDLDGILKDNYKCCIGLGKCFANSQQHSCVLNNFPFFKEEIFNVLKKQRAMSQPFYAFMIQLLILAIVTKQELQLLKGQFQVSLQ